MDRASYLFEIKKRLTQHFSAANDGYKIPSAERHRLEGFIQGATFMKFATQAELNAIMEEAHKAVFGLSIEERRKELAPGWRNDNVDYSKFDQPTVDPAEH